MRNGSRSKIGLTGGWVGGWVGGYQADLQKAYGDGDVEINWDGWDGKLGWIGWVGNI